MWGPQQVAWKGVVGLSFPRELRPWGYLLCCRPRSQILPGNAFAQCLLALVGALRLGWEQDVDEDDWEHFLNVKEMGQIFFKRSLAPSSGYDLFCVLSLVISVLKTSPSAASRKIPLCSQGQMLSQITSSATQLSEAAVCTVWLAAGSFSSTQVVVISISWVSLGATEHIRLNAASVASI